jgi:hypothetical protein
MTQQIPVQTIIDPKTDSGLTSYNTTISKVPTNAANVFVTSVTNNTTQINTQVFQTQTNANAAAGASTQVQFNDRGILTGSPGFTFNTNTTTLTVTGNVITGTIRTNNLQWQNGDPMMFSYSNANVVNFLPTYGGNLSATQVTALNFVGNGALLSNITGSTVTGTVASANYATESNRANTVMSASQPNITSVGTLLNLTVEGSVQANNISATNSIFANRIAGDGGNISNITGAFVTGVVANANYAALSGTANTVSTSAQPNITSVGILTGLQVGGNLLVSNADLGNMVYANHYSGNGSMLNNLTGANVTGVVPMAEESNVAVNVSSSSQPNITSVGTLTSLTVTGAITGSNVNFDTVNAQFLVGDGGNITDIAATEIVGTVANATHAAVAATANTVAGANVTGTVANATHSNTSAVAYSVAGANVTGTVADAAHAIVADSANSVAGADVTGTVANATHAISSDSASSVAGANVTGQVSNALVSGTVYTNAQPNITSVGTLTSLSVTGSVSAGNITVSGAISAASVAGDAINLSNIPGANVAGTVANAAYATTAGVVSISSQPNITSVGTLTTVEVLTFANVGHLVANGNVSGNVISGNLFVGSGANLTNIPAANISGTVANATYAVNANAANASLVAATVTDSSQPNITSVGTLASITVSGVSDLGAVGNVKITGGSNGQALVTDGAGNLSFSTVATESYVASEISNVINGAPGALNTLNELANALANDASYSTTITNALANKANISDIPSLTGYATESYVTSQGYITSASLTYSNISGTPTIGNVAAANFDGSASNVLYGNGVFAAVTGGGGGISLTSLSVSSTTASGGGSLSYDNTTGAFTFAPASVPSLTGYATESYVTSQGYITSASLTYSNISGTPTLATVATSGDYSDLINKPTLFDGTYANLSGKPTLFDGAYTSLTGAPTLATVATSGLYSDLTGNPTIPADVNQLTDTNGLLSGAAYEFKSSNFNVSVKKTYMVSTTAGAVTATLPASPTTGDWFVVYDFDQKFSTNNLTINGNGKNVRYWDLMGSPPGWTAGSGTLALNQSFAGPVGTTAQRFVYDGTVWSRTG